MKNGLKLTKRIPLSPLFDEGVFPIKISIYKDGIETSKEFTIKVGGTEIY